MPRVKLAGERYKNEDLSRLFRRKKAEHNLTNEKIAGKIGVDRRTVASYLSRPDDMPLSFFRKICNVLGIKEADVSNIVL